MGSEWEIKPISELCVLIVDCVNKTAPKVDRVTPYKMLRTTNVRNGRVDVQNCKYVEKNTFEIWTRRAKVLEGDIILTREAPLGEVGRVEVQDTIFLGQRLVQYRVDDTVLDSKFLLYSFLSPFLQHQFNMFEGTGSVVSHIRVPDCLKFKIPLPLLYEQKAIAHILGSLDDKIELNRQINKTLESMVQALFKSWFVDFDPVIDNALAAGNPIPEPLQERAAKRVAWISDSAIREQNQTISQQFPSEFEFNEEMGWIPLGWEVDTLLELIELIGGGTPKTSVDEYWNGDIPWFSVVDAPNVSDVFVIDTEKHVTPLGVEKSSTKILPVGTTIISARGTVGKCAMVSRPMTMNQSCYGVRGKNNISDIFIYYTILLQVSGLQQRSHGSVFSTITRDTFKSICVPFGGVNLTLQFEQIVKPYFDKILDNSIQSKALTKLRDTLLPKLLSGEIRIPDAEKLIAEVI